MREQSHCEIRDDSQVGAARRFAANLSESVGLDETLAGRVSIIVTELGRNIVLHGKGGSLMLQAIRRPTRTGVEIIAVDSGPGMADPEQCLRDGYSTAGTPGTGLGGVRRLATEFDLHSAPDKGAVVLARVMTAPRPASEWNVWGAVCTPAPKEEATGDAWEIAERDDAISIALADGLGHGIFAAEAARAATAAFREKPFDGVSTVLTQMHERMRGTRGAAAAVASCSQSGAISFGGVGNIAASLISPVRRSRGLASYNGTLGVEARIIRELPYQWEQNDLLVMHSDGVQSRWSADNHPGLLARHPGVIAAVLHRDFLRGRDDATVVVVRRAA